MQGTIDLNEYMNKKREEEFRTAFEKVGRSLDGLPIGVAMTVLAHTARNCVSAMPPIVKEQNIKVFGDLMRATDEEVIPAEKQPTIIQ